MTMTVIPGECLGIILFCIFFCLSNSSISRNVNLRSLCTPSLQYACCPLIQADKQRQPERAREITTQDIEEPVFALIYSGKAYQQDVERGKDLQGDQRPAITPCTHGARKTEIQQKAIKEYHVEDDSQDDTCGRRVVEHADKVENGGDP